jgi:hypothetical protein
MWRIGYLRFLLQGFERKHNQDRAMSSYQPFSATHGPGGGFDTGGEDFEPGYHFFAQSTSIFFVLSHSLKDFDVVKKKICLYFNQPLFKYTINECLPVQLYYRYIPVILLLIK